MAYRKKNGDLDMRYNDSKKKSKESGNYRRDIFFHFVLN